MSGPHPVRVTPLVDGETVKSGRPAHFWRVPGKSDGGRLLRRVLFGSRSPEQRPRRRWPYRSLIGLGLLLIAGVAAWQGYATWWEHRSSSTGKALVHGFIKDNHLLENPALSSPLGTATPKRTSTLAPGTARLASCSAPAPAKTDPVRGLLEIPKLGVVAPVEEGLGDAQLNVAVGHDTASVWPGLDGNAVLAAHDVSYFQTLPRLSVGDAIRYVTPCRSYLFHVESHAVVKQGSPVYDTTNPTMTLVTCWPTNALWYTPDRYIVTAVEVATETTGRIQRDYRIPPSAPRVPVPEQLATQGVTLTTYSLPMGTLSLAGTPDRAWAQTTAPLLNETAAVEAYIAGTRALTEKRLVWWHAVAPGVAAPTPLVGAHNPLYASALDVTVRADGDVAEAVQMVTTVEVTGGSAPGTYRVDATATITNDTLVLSRWTMTPA